MEGAAPYSSSLTWAPHVAPWPSSSTWMIARCVMKRAGAAPCSHMDGPPACAPYEDRNGRLLVGSDLLDRPGAVGWLAAIEVGAVVPHIRNNVDCTTCHGDVAKGTVATRNVEHTMGFCVDCHRAKKASNDCLTCHF